MRTFLALLALTTVYCCSTVQGQSIFEMPDGQTVPDRLLQNPATQKPWLVWVASEGYRPRRAWREDAPVNPGVRLRFMLPLFIAAEHKDLPTAKEYLFLAKSDATGQAVGEPIGWVNKDMVVLQQDALKDEVTTILRKAMIVNKPETLGKATADFSPEKAGVLSAPDDSASVRRTFQLYNVFFVYAETDTHLLVGSGPQFSADEDVPGAADKVVQGWLPKDRAIQWNTREAFEWDRPSTLLEARPRRSFRGLIWENDTAANSWLQGAEGQGSEPTSELAQQVLFREALGPNAVSKLLSPKDVRFPILGKPTRDPATDNKLYKVAWVDSSVGREIYAKMDEAQEAVRNLDVLVVIDDTDTMDPYFPAAAKAIEGILNGVHTAHGQGPESHLRVAVAYYADDGIDPQTNRPNSLVPFKPMRLVSIIHQNEINKLIEEVKGHHSQGGGDAPESVFHGIIHAIDGAYFNPYHQQLVIAIGDMGDRSLEEDDVHTEKDKVVDKLCRNVGIPIEFYAIRVETDASRNGHEDAKRYETQMKAIVRRLNERIRQRLDPKGALKPVSFAGYVHMDNADKVTEQVIERYKELRREADQVSDTIRRYQRGEFRHTEVGPAALLRFKAHNIPVETLQQWQGMEVCHPGFVWEKTAGSPAIPQVRTRVLLEKARLTKITEKLDELVQGTNSATLADIVERLVRDLTGDPQAKGSLQDAFFKKEGLPVRSPLLVLTPREIRDRKNLEDELPKLMLKLDKLKDVLNGVDSDWELKKKSSSAGQDVFRPVCTKSVPLDRSFKIPGDPFDNNWYWIDLLEELP